MNTELITFLRDLANSYEMSRGNIMKKHVDPIRRAADIIEAADAYVAHFYRHNQGDDWDDQCNLLRFKLAQALIPPKA